MNTNRKKINTKPNYNLQHIIDTILIAKDASSFPEGDQKCNYFLDDLSKEIGIPLDGDYSAADWANPNKDIPGWSKAYNGKPSRGTSYAYKYHYSDGATGHSGVITIPKVDTLFITDCITLGVFISIIILIGAILTGITEFL